MATKAAGVSGLVVASIAAIAVACGAAAVGASSRDAFLIYVIVAFGSGFLIGAALILLVYVRTGACIQSPAQALKDLWEAFGRSQL